METQIRFPAGSCPSRIALVEDVDNLGQVPPYHHLNSNLPPPRPTQTHTHKQRTKWRIPRPQFSSFSSGWRIRKIFQGSQPYANLMLFSIWFFVRYKVQNVNPDITETDVTNAWWKYFVDVFWLAYWWDEAGNATDSRWYYKACSREVKPFSILECTIIPERPGPESGRWKRWWKSCQWAPPGSRSLASSPALAQENLPYCVHQSICFNNPSIIFLNCQYIPEMMQVTRVWLPPNVGSPPLHINFSLN